MRRSFVLAVAVVAIVGFAATGIAQDVSTGAVHGTVFDPAIRRIAGASVAVVNSATGFRYQQPTNGQGQFAFELLPPGDYAARVTSEGMSPQLSKTLHVEIGGVTDIAFQMTLAGTRESVTVSAEPKAVESESRGLSSVIDERAILNLPLNGRRFTDLALLTPGVTQDPRGPNSTSNGDLAFGGIRGFQTSYLVDGADNNNAFFAQATGRYRAPYQFSNEVIQEFRVSPNSVSAESGRTGGAVVNLVTKSGSNKFHGTGFYYLRDSSFDASDPFLNVKPADQQHQFGFTVGGLLRRNRVFFFASFDQHIFHEPTVVRFVNGGSVVIPQPGAGPARLPAIMRPATRAWYLPPPHNYRSRQGFIPHSCWATPASPSST
jgi:Carboxypeptidase regulatory-like domain